ncbi:Sensor protein kinase WalK [Planktothrix agardhii]|uniref:histidine kinase n=1 Tax=Planktothrix agardhii TaxID=1160 RepID=A0A1J1JAN9_PLAAG|nr:DICT sensory domain-containing protein [Planktothrix agardhii]CAD5970759.1 Sensor protein kinase WalK [Planktothrix agardhii]CUM58536.1 putative Histidine kinase [Planktothrix agardhii]
MSVSTSVLTELVQFLPSLKPQIYFKSSLTALSHAMEDQVLATTEQPLVIATFQQERFYRQEAHRYRKIAAITPQVYVMAAEKTEFQNSSDIHETVAFDPQDKLSQEWNLLVLGQYYATCLVCVEREDLVQNKERKERLVNSITSTIRQSLNPQEVIKVATHELGEAMGACRCLIYRCKATDNSVKISNEYLCNDVVSIIGKTWLLRENPLFQEVVKRQEPIYINQTDEIDIDWLNNNNNNSVKSQESLKKITQKLEIKGWLMIPILYQGQLLGMVELHQCNCNLSEWQEDDLLMVDAIATQLGAAIIQAETYANLEDLNQQLEALERTRSNLIAITGHELRTPLSTILICLESLNQEPDMPVEMRKVMLDTALEDAERLRKLVQDFLKLSHLESGRVDWNPESLRLKECIDLAISGIRTHHNQNQVPAIQTEVPSNLPLVQADGEWLVELLSKLLDNACKFTNSDGKVKINAKCNGDQMMEVTISDTGRGIEPNRLDAVFERFYQEEGSLRRSVGGTGLGLAISRQIVNGWGGEIWADSQGKNQGSQFHFTIPYVESDS